MNNNTYTHQRKARRGFSLLELTLVILIIGVLMGVAAVAFAPALLRGRTTGTEASMTTIKRAILEYQGVNNQYPSQLADLSPNFIESVSLDGWDNPFYYAVPGQNGQPFDLISAGEDGDYSTLNDNINIWTMNQPTNQ
ncbi:MAG: type II secretion system protein GspG [Phycisphaera sp.]|nr:MAG: type II secretion system protein GspG [Phycisphaera sp.]